MLVAVILAMSERLIRVWHMTAALGATSVALVAGSGSAGAASVQVRPGQTLTQLAQQYGTTVAALEAANGLSNPNQIVAGSTLQIPGNRIVVAVGQTLSSIAASHGTTVPALEAANGLSNPNQIVAGSTLQLPVSSGIRTSTSSNAPSGHSVVVRSGQTLSSIAAANGTTVAALESLNGIANPNHIVIGSVLQLPGNVTPTAVAPSSSSIVIRPGQTLSSIAATHGTTTAALEAVNGLANPNLIVAGMHLRLPESSGMSLASYVTDETGILPAALASYPNRLALRPVFAHWAAVSGDPLALLEAMCWWESGWQTAVTSVTNAIGVCQLEPATVTEMKTQLGLRSLNPTVASDNIEMAAAYLHQLLAATGNNDASALAGYYQGLASVARSGRFPSTRQYVSGILAYVPYFS
jgi:LysM repeat protein